MAIGSPFGATDNAYCDRRYVDPGGEPSAFCQEIIETLASSEFQDDCRDKHLARADDGRCPQERIIGGCKLRKENDDGSIVYDWYYDISDADGGGTFATAPRTPEDVAELCADPKRYEEGADFARFPIPIPKLP